MVYKFIFLCIFSAALPACSLYESEGRKKFESAAEASLSSQSLQRWFKSLKNFHNHQMQCDDISEIQYWYEKSFPLPHTDWVESKSENTEVWQSLKEDGSVIVKSYENTPPTITRCQISFSSVNDWQSYQEFYLKSLEGAHL